MKRIIALIAAMSGAVLASPSGGPQPAVGLYWYFTGDPTSAPGICAPQYQLGFRTDTNTSYVKTGASCTAWSVFGTSGGGTLTGTGTSPDLSVWTGPTVLGNYGGSSAVCTGSAVQSVTESASGGLTATCVAVGSGTVTGTGTSPDIAIWASGTGIGNYVGSSATCTGSAVQSVTESASGGLTATCVAVGSGTVTGTGSANYVATWTSTSNQSYGSGSGILDTLVLQRPNLSPQNGLGRIGWQGVGGVTILNDWSPTGLAANGVQLVAASDNQGTMITGVCATTTCGASQNFNLGDIIYVCNENATQDAGVIQFSNKDSRSIAADQIVVPDSGVLGTVSEATFSVSAGNCVPLMYAEPDPVNFSGTFYWMVLAPSVRMSREVVQFTSWFPNATIQNLTGTINNFDVNNTDVPDGGPQGYATTIASASNGSALPQSTINVATSSPAFAGPGAGTLIPITITASAGATSVLCTGVTSTTFTGCTGGHGTMSTGNAVQGGLCEAGATCLFDDYTPIIIGEVDGTGVTLSGMNWNTNSSPTGLGPVKIIYNAGPGPIVLENQNAGSITTNQFLFPTGANLTIPVEGSIMLWHAATQSYWLQIGTLPYSGSTSIAVSSANVITANLNNGTTQTATTGQCFTQMTGLGIMSSSVFVNAAGTNLTLSGSTLSLAAAPTIAAGSVFTEALEAVGPAITPSALTSASQTNNWQPGSSSTGIDSTFFRTTTSSTGTAQISGMTGPAASFNPGLRKLLCNYGTGPLQMLNENASSSAGNKFFLPFTLSTNPTYTVPYGGCVEVVYDNNGVWIPIGTGVTSHETSYGPAPTLTSCGTGSPSIVGTDSAGTITEGTTATGCILTFAAAFDTFADVPSCNIQAMNANPATFTYTVSRTAITITNTSATGDVIAYHCTQTKN